MRKIIFFFYFSLPFLGFTQSALKPTVVLEERLAFPGAFGYGRFTTGGRGGRIIEVTNTLNSGAGSLRDALLQTGPRIILIRTSGIINLTSYLYIDEAHSDFTIIGQTAPGEGVTLTGWPLLSATKNDQPIPQSRGANNLIIRNITHRKMNRIKPDGDNAEEDCLTFRASTGLIYLDHISTGYGADESISVQTNKAPFNGVTIANCFMAECDPNHNTGSIIGSSSDRGILEDAGNITYAYNGFYNISHRFPNPSGGANMQTIEMYNNFVSNWKSKISRINGSGQFDYTNNYFKFGNVPKTINLTLTWSWYAGYDVSIYTRQNYIEGLKENTTDDDKMLWKYFRSQGGKTQGANLESSYFQTTRHSNTPFAPQGLLSTMDVPEYVLANAGHNRGTDSTGNPVNARDAKDRGYINAIRTDTESTSYPTLAQQFLPAIVGGSLYVDLNENGIADTFEATHGLIGDGTNITSFFDFGTYQVKNDAGYEDREIYWSWLAGDFENIEKITESSNSILINNKSNQVTSYSSQDYGDFDISDAGTILELAGNSWKKVDLDYTITSNTVLEFDFKVDGSGEIHGVGFDNDTSLNTGGNSGELFFKLFGTQNVSWANSNYENYNQSDGWKSYSITVGDYLTGNKKYIVFYGDKDSDALSQKSYFRNIKLKESEIKSNADIWIESECAVVGSKWSVISDSSASNGYYIAPPSGNQTNSAPTDSASFVTFQVNRSAGVYKIYGRVLAPSGSNDSFWVRVNSGSWAKWNLIEQSDNFIWDEVHNQPGTGVPVPITFNFVDGNNTIDIANREEGTLLDKIYITKTETIPLGRGEPGINCFSDILVSDVLISDSSIILPINETSVLTATVMPVDATNQGVKWSSNNVSVATIDQNGSVTGISEGSATIAVTTDDGGMTDTSVVTVISSSSTITLEPIHDAYLQGSSKTNSKLLKVNQGNRVTYLKYDLSSVPGNIKDAELRFRITDDTGSGTAEIYKGSDTGWTETNLSTSNKPIESSLWGSTMDLRDTTDDVVIPLSATGTTGGGFLSLIVRHVGGDDFAFASKEHGSKPAPRLVVTYEITSSSLKASLITNNEMSYNTIRIFPNPTAKTIMITGLEGEKEISVMDLGGRIIFKEKSVLSEPVLDLSDYSLGIYYINIKTQNQKKTFKVIKK